MTTVGKKIAEIRKQKGLTQEELSEAAKINLRTLQRIEKDETEPRGNSLQGICAALGVPVENILDYGKTEDPGYLVYLHLSVLGFCVIPLGNIILPLVLWLNKRDKVKEVHTQGANIINFQIFYTVLYTVLLITGALGKILHWGISFENLLVTALVLAVLNFVYAIVCAIAISKGTVRHFYPVPVRFIK